MSPFFHVSSIVLLSLPSKMTITNDDQFLLTASEDGCIFIWKVHDKEGGGLKGEQELQCAEEVLIMRSDIDEKVGGATREHQPWDFCELHLHDACYQPVLHGLHGFGQRGYSKLLQQLVNMLAALYKQGVRRKV